MEQPTQAEALRTIAEWPITDPNNMDAVNMAAVAQQALRASQQAELAVPFCYVSLNNQGDITRTVKRKDAWSKKPLYEAAPVQQAGDAEDARRWRRLVNASELSFPVTAISDDPENDGPMVYGRRRMESFIDRLDEIPNSYAAIASKQP
jgi:hypothetical protein